MCGLIGGAGLDGPQMGAALDSIAHRGPDGRGWHRGPGGIMLGHTRLAVQDLTDAARQPYTVGGTVVTYNGELWNAGQLRAELRAAGADEFTSTGDTEVVAAALDLWGPAALERLDGMFALAWTDGRETWLARDRFGEIPLHVGRGFDGLLWCSEIGPLLAAGAHPATVSWVHPGTVVQVSTGTVRRWAPSEDLSPATTTRTEASGIVRADLGASVARRLVSDVPVAVLASGGVDSSAIIGLARTLRPEVELIAYTAVHDPRSRDLRCARALCERHDVPLVEVEVPAPSADDLASVVRAIEMPHKAQVEIGWACLHLADAIAADGRKVVLTGEGSDELWASYGMAFHGIKAKGWHRFRAELFLGQHRKNFPRCNKIFMARGIEARLPFLDPPLVSAALRWPQAVVAEKGNPKVVLSDAVRDLTGDEIADRAKVAFQKGAKLDRAAAGAVGDPRAFYARQQRALFGEVRP